MERFNDKILGDVVLYKDFIKKSGFDDHGRPTYKQSNTKLQGYGSRTVGICKFNNKYMVAVAINYNPAKDDEKVVKYTIKQRLHTILQNDFDILPQDDGFTYVPQEWSSLLWKDPDTYSILHGIIDPSYGQIIIKDLNAQSSK